jgi:uncharacterized protein YcbX
MPGHRPGRRSSGPALPRYLEKKVRLVRMEPSCMRIVDQKYANSPDNVVSFADGFPVLVISDESLAELNRRLEYPLPMNRFRPNITIGGSVRICRRWLV